ncbi:hypothetical protein GCM10010256_79990 [Streptomyces coeruleorubidus]|nr:hypothetical protein GCM10010256_79990 [Streptomyces coeruleorubidus]
MKEKIAAVRRHHVNQGSQITARSETHTRPAPVRVWVTASTLRIAETQMSKASS